MKMKVIAMLATCALTASAVQAQELPRKVQNVEVLDLDGKPAKLPYFGEKNLMIFYVDPDRHKQNEDFTIELEQNHRAESDNIHGSLNIPLIFIALNSYSLASVVFHTPGIENIVSRKFLTISTSSA